MGSGWDYYVLPGESDKETTYETICPRCGRRTIYDSWVRGAFCDGAGTHRPVRLRLRLRKTEVPPEPLLEEDPLEQVLIDIPARERVVARKLLVSLDGEQPTLTHEIQKRMQLSPLSLVTVIDFLINLGLVDVRDEGTPKEAIVLTTRAKRLLKRTSEDM
jgi:hypothetical protein